MRLRRGPLFWGLLLVPLGAIPLLVRAGVLPADAFTDAWRLWPLILVAIGLAILLGRGRAGIVGTIVVALALGIAGGGALASGNLWFAGIADCTSSTASLTRTTDSGTFDGSASVRLDLDCGSAKVSSASGSGWTLTADHRGAPPAISSSSSSLDVRSPDAGGPRRQEWTLGLPTGTTRAIDLTANAASTTFSLEGMQLDRFRADLNAGDLRVDGGGAGVGRLDVTVNAGRARITLGSGATTGSLSTNAGAIELCVPASSALVLEVDEQLTFVTNLGQRGLAHDGDTWTRAGSSDQTIDLKIDGNAASFSLDPDGGC